MLKKIHYQSNKTGNNLFQNLWNRSPQSLLGKHFLEKNNGCVRVGLIQGCSELMYSVIFEALAVLDYFFD